MNHKELNEIRRRWKVDRNSVTKIYGCYVNGNKDIISTFESSVGLMRKDEQEIYFKLLGKTLSGTLDKNLINIEFETQQVVKSDEHDLLMELKKTLCSDDDSRVALFEKIRSVLSLKDELNYLILLAGDGYDVPHFGKNKEKDPFDFSETFKYFLCCVCPVKPSALGLGYNNADGGFHSTDSGQIVCAPCLGFMFPTFDDRSANIYNALYYSANPGEIHQELIDVLFNILPPMSAPEQKEAFGSALVNSLKKSCSFDVVQMVNDKIRDRIEEHKEQKDPEKLEMSIGELSSFLRDSGLEEEKISAFENECEKSFGQDAQLNPNNIVDTKKTLIETADIVIKVPPDMSYTIDAKVIEGRKYILIPADKGVEINGIKVDI